jgi:hypothetical protein
MKASRVVFWLGEEADDSNLAMSQIKLLGNIEDRSQDILEYWQAYPSLKLLKPWQALQKLCSRAVWTRAWILQEFTLASSLVLVCGEKRVARGTLLACFRRWEGDFQSETMQDQLQGHQAQNPELVRAISECMVPMNHMARTRLDREANLGKDFESMPEIWQVLLDNISLRATDPRDRIISLLGITSHEIVPDYSKSVSEVYSQFALQQMQDGRPVLALAGAGPASRDPSSYKLPSWVPDWQNQTAIALALPFYALCQTFHWETSALVASMDYSNESLWIDGVICDSCQTSLSPVEHLCSILVEHKDILGDASPGDISPAQVFFRTIFLDIDYGPYVRLFRSGSVSSSLVDGFIFYLVALDRALRGLDTSNFDPDTDIPKPILSLLRDRITGQPDASWPDRDPETARLLISEMLEKAKFTSQNMAYFTTDVGYLGVAPKSCQESDIVCTFPGMKGVYMLRPVMDSYVLIGPCFVLGLMDGEMEDAVKAGLEICEGLYRPPIHLVLCYKRSSLLGMPSWSWLSMSGGIEYRNYLEDVAIRNSVIVTSKAKFITCSISWSSTPLTSTLLSATLVLKGLLFKASSVCVSSDRRRYPVLTAIGYDGVEFQGARLDEEVKPFPEAVWCFEVTTQEFRTTPGSGFNYVLILLSVNKETETYRRIGIGEFRQKKGSNANTEHTDYATEFTISLI